MYQVLSDFEAKLLIGAWSHGERISVSRSVVKSLDLLLPGLFFYTLMGLRMTITCSPLHCHAIKIGRGQFKALDIGIKTK